MAPPSISTHRVLLVGTVLFIGVAFYTLVVTHHLHLSSSFDRASSIFNPSSLIANKLFGSASLDTSDPHAIVDRLINHGSFHKYDADEDGKLSEAELSALLLDLAASRVIPAGSSEASAAQRQQSQQQPAATPKDGNGKDAKWKAVVGSPSLSEEAAAAALAAIPEDDDYIALASLTEEAPPGSAAPKATPTPSPVPSPVPTRSSTPVLTPVPTSAFTPSSTSTGCPELSKELIGRFAVDNTIMLTVCDFRIFETFGINWMKHLNDLGVGYYIVGATDAKTSAFMSDQGHQHCFKFFEEGMEQHADKEYKYNSDHYRAATWRKVTVVEMIVGWGFNVLHSDVDVVWFHDPLVYFLGPLLGDVDVAVSTDMVSTNNPVKDAGLEVGAHQHVNVNTGVYFVKATPGGKEFMSKWAGLRESMQHDNDQVGLYRYVRNTPAVMNHEQRCIQLEGGPKLGLLSVSVLLNGYSYFIPRLHEAQGVAAMGIHMTWLPLSKEGKFHRMRDGMLYHDNPEYYTQPYFITADIDFPTAPSDFNKWMDTEAMIQVHLKAMDKQLVQMYRVMAMAVMLNRTLILPKMHCFCYKNWFMMDQCRIPGDRTTQFPLECPLDQWLRPKVLYNYGANIKGKNGAMAFEFREHTLLENPRFPEELRKAQVAIEPGTKACDEEGQACAASEPAAGADGILAASVPKHLKQSQLEQVLAKFKDVKVLRLRKPMRLWGGFDDAELKTTFEAFVDKVAGNWCCRDKPFIDKGWPEKEKLSIVETLTVRKFNEDKNKDVPDPAW